MTKFKTVKRKAEVGERILIIDANSPFGTYCNGDVFTVREEFPRDVRVYEHTTLIFHDEYEVIIENETEAGGMKKTTKKITVAEDYQETIGFNENTDGTYSLNFKQMPALVHVSYDGNGTFDQLFIHGEHKAEAQRVTIDSAVGELTKYTIESTPAIKTEIELTGGTGNPHTVSMTASKSLQQLRDEIVDRAKRDVVEILNEYQLSDKEVTFTKDNRTINVSIEHLFSGKVLAKGIAKCAPNDCFNVHIGKAIALRRALGLEVPAEYLSAPQPTEVRVGDVVETFMSDGTPHLTFKVTGFWDEDGTALTHDKVPGFTSFDPGYGDKIIDDSREGVSE